MSEPPAASSVASRVVHRPGAAGHRAAEPWPGAGSAGIRLRRLFGPPEVPAGRRRDRAQPWPPAEGASSAATVPGPARAASAGLARAAGAAADPDPPGVGEPAVRRVPAPLRERLPGPGPFDPQRRGVRALAAVAVPVLVLAAFLAWRARPQVEPAAPATLGAGPVAQAPAPSPSAEQLVVAVAGKVRRPGLVRLPPGARVADAITAAGGPLPGADLSAVNLARRLTDGELVAVGVPGAAEPAGPPGPGPAPAPGGRVNLNTATASQLDALPGVGPVLAQRIVAHREQRGAFRAVSDLRAVDGIGAARFEQLKDLVTV